MRTLVLLASLALTACGDNGLVIINTAPDVTLLDPSGGQEFVEGAPAVLVARVSDAETPLDALDVVWSTDRGPLTGEPGRDGDDVTLTVAGFPSGPLTLTVTAIDEQGESTSDSADIVVFVNRAPEVQFTEPADNAQLVFGEPVTVRIVASDDRDEPEDLTLAWTNATGPEHPNDDGTATVVLSDLPVGAQDIAVDVSDTLGASTTARLALFITDGDVDADGFTSTALGGTDCDDGDAAVFPGAPETCNEVDDDCDDTVDESNPTAPAWYLDDDGDRFGAGPIVRACAAPADHVADNTDCDDTRAAVNPDATEVCNTRDDNCDGTVDTDAVDRVPSYTDADDDGFGAGSVQLFCVVPSGRVTNADDCDDGLAAVNPNATEVCNTRDDNCDGTVDTDAVDRTRFYRDRDTDDFGDPDTSQLACSPPAGHVRDATDCDDMRGSTFPGAPETCNALDDDCDGAIDESPTDPTVFYEDDDGDTYGNPSVTRSACVAPSGFVSNALDCDDDDALIHPFRDGDSDGSNACLDCDDNDADRRPGLAERCDGKDNDCNGVIPSNETTNTDGDAFVTCADCDDADGSVFPGAVERCNGRDDDCDTDADENACPCPVYQDTDGTPYQFCEGSLNWGEALDACGADYELVSIDSASENAFLRGVIIAFPWDTPPTGQSADDAWWTGGSRDTGSSGQLCGVGASPWQWESGAAFSYTNWRAGEPNSTSGCEGCIEIWLDDINGEPRAEWNDEDCGRPRNWICEGQ